MTTPEVPKRTAGSCNHCRQHKTKCIRLENGSCKRCVRTARPCVTSNIRTGRPYYQSSKEQFDLLTSVVRHFLPNASLNKESLRQIVAKLPANASQAISHDSLDQDVLPDAAFENDGPEVVSLDPVGDSPTLLYTNATVDTQAISTQPRTEGRLSNDTIRGPHGQTRSVSNLDSSSDPVLHASTHSHSQHQCYDASRRSITGSVHHTVASHRSETFPTESIARKDVMEITRYDSGTSWPAFFSKINATTRPGSSTLFPTPASALDDLDDLRSSNKQQADMITADDLPSRAEFELASSKFFAEINCVNYILSYETYHAYTINAFQPKARLSHSVFMLLCLILSLDEDHEQYFAKASEHFEHVLEEGSLATVEALMLMALCRLNRNQRNLAWITVGCATRTAQTLGLHLNESYWEEKSQTVIENRKRLWWSLYDMEVCLAFRLGRCVGIDLSSCGVGMPSETVFNYVPNCPPNYHTAVSELGRITGLIVQDLYGSRTASTCLDDRADELIADLESFYQSLPYHLRSDAPTAPSHSRAVLYLGLRYHYTMLIATRPSIIACWRDPAVSCARLTRRVEKFETANKESLLLLKRMAQADLLSGKCHLDASYILGGLMIFLLRAMKDPSQQLLDEAAEHRPILEIVQHLDIVKAGMRTFDTTIDEVKSMLNFQGQLQDVEYTSIDGFLQGLMDADDCIWPALPAGVAYTNLA